MTPCPVGVNLGSPGKISTGRASDLLTFARSARQSGFHLTKYWVKCIPNEILNKIRVGHSWRGCVWVDWALLRKQNSSFGRRMWRGKCLRRCKSRYRPVPWCHPGLILYYGLQIPRGDFDAHRRCMISVLRMMSFLTLGWFSAAY